MNKTNIIINTQFSAIHCWPTCYIDEVKYLKNDHRHLFTVKAKAEVSHNNRDIEFISLKNAINRYIHDMYENKSLGLKSCEMLAEQLLSKFPQLNYVRIMEDGENGAEVFKIGE